MTPQQILASKIVPAIRNYFTLGFLPDSTGSVPMALGKPTKTSKARLAWELAVWALLAVGIFIRQGLALPALDWTVQHLTPGSFAASAAISLAVFPTFMRWLNGRRSTPGLAHVATPFAFGF